ncbi:MAG: cytochrome c oxidase subunit II [Methylotenera sp.]|nr:cytochrome c oxidase subunit II [Oligoflexia bacterium]
MFFNEAYAGNGLPIQGTDVAVMWDSLYNFLLWLSVFFFILVVGGMIYLAVRYRKREGDKSKYITGNHLIEAIWTIVPTILLLGIFAWGYQVYSKMVHAPSDAMEIRVIGKQWLWQFQYEDGKSTIGELYVPINKPVKLIMSSEDVLHSFFIPNFRVKQDVVPGMYSSVWFEAKVPGQHQVFCTEYCGFSHSGMLAKVIVLQPDEWAAWKKGKSVAGGIGTVGVSGTQGGAPLAAESLPAQGKKLTEAKGCVACHSDDGSTKIGPTYKGLFGSKVELQDGSTVVADENYIRESIMKPQAKVVKGFNPVMPTFQGLVSESEMNAIVAYIKSLK